MRVCALAGQQAQGQQGGRIGKMAGWGNNLVDARVHTANYNGNMVICKGKMGLRLTWKTEVRNQKTE